MNLKPLYITLLLIAQHSYAEEFIVNGNTELYHKVAQANCGDNIRLTQGNYPDLQLRVTQRCTSDNPLKINASQPGTVSITGDSKITITGNNIQLSGIHFQKGSRTQRADLITVTGQYNLIANNKFTDIDLADGVWIQLNGHKNQVINNEFTGKRSLASYINVDVKPQITSSHRIAYNYFSRPLLGSNGGSASRVGHGSMHDFNSRVIFEYNLFEQENGESEIISAKSSENIFRYNTFKNSEGNLSLRQGKRSLVYDNYFLGSGQPKQAGLFVRGEDHVVFNNYFADLTPHPKKTDFGTISFGAASAKADPKRAKKGLNPFHFPLTKNILFANNSIVNSSSSAIVIGSQFALKDKKNRTRLPESIYLINNIIEKAPATLTLTQAADDIQVFTNVYANAANTYAGIINDSKISSKEQSGIKLLKTEKQPSKLADWIDKINLDMRWQENINLVKRIKSSADLGFVIPSDAQGKQVLPLQKNDVGTNW